MIDEQNRARKLEWSIDGLRRSHPDLSAATQLSSAQRRFVWILLAIIVIAFVLDPRATGITMVALAMSWYLANLLDRSLLVARGMIHPELMQISDEEALALSDESLPSYTVLLPAFGEEHIVEQLMQGVGKLDYPRDKLEIKLLLEADDVTMVQMALQGDIDQLAEVVLVPASEPRTKPKACNYGLSSSTGEFVTIYDAEDVPDPLQLRRVVAAFAQLPDDVACIQARLAYFNDRQNLLTRWFTVEYDQWFGFVLPALCRTGAPLPLGGTSNHLRRSLLLEIGAWDPFNVTEDADLGIRLARSGYRTAVLDSVTLEEANSDVLNWVRQRSRWYKGYLQTLLVHTRSPRQALRAFGVRGFLRFVTTMAGPATTSLLNVLFASVGLLWLAGRPSFITAILPAPLYYAGLSSFVLGYISSVYMGLLTTRIERKPYLIVAVLLSPLYWVLMSVAAIKAVLQLIFQPSYWEKTAHGLSTQIDSTGGMSA
jgi:glycosyltransferase XagB